LTDFSFKILHDLLISYASLMYISQQDNLQVFTLQEESPEFAMHESSDCNIMLMHLSIILNYLFRIGFPSHLIEDASCS